MGERREYWYRKRVYTGGAVPSTKRDGEKKRVSSVNGSREKKRSEKIQNQYK